MDIMYINEKTGKPFYVSHDEDEGEEEPVKGTRRNRTDWGKAAITVGTFICTAIGAAIGAIIGHCITNLLL